MEKKFKQSLMVLMSLIMIMSMLAACSGANNVDTNASNEKGDGQKYEGTIKIWTWDKAAFENASKEFNKVYPDIKIELTNVAPGDYLQKIQTTLASGGELPDIIVGERNVRGKLFELDIWENLEKEPYNFDKSIVFDYLEPLTTNPKGEVVAIETSLTPAALAYRRDLAKQYFGTDDRKELEAMFPTIDAMIEKGKEVQEKSNGQVFMFSGLGDLNEMFTAQSQKALMDGDVIDVTGKMKDVVEKITKVRDAGIVDKLVLFSPQWNASFADGKHIFFPAANWSAQFLIKPNDKEGEGRWGLMKPPGNPFSWGGTVMGISKQSKNKELAWTFINWVNLTKEGAEAGKLVNNLSPLKSVYEDPQFFSSPDPFFANQDVGKFWIEEIVPEIKVPEISANDAVVRDSTGTVLELLNSDRTVDADEAIEKIVEEVKAKRPDDKVK